MPATKAYWWMPAPFLRLLPALMLGIAISWYGGISVGFWMLLGSGSLLFLFLYSFLHTAWRYRLKLVCGASVFVALASLGGWLVTVHDIRNDPGWFGSGYTEGTALVAVLEEVPVAKTNSYKAVASVRCLQAEGHLTATKGKIILYFKKSTGKLPLTYGSTILLRKPLQPIQNSGNPGAFDYQRYCLFQGITHQVFLKEGDYVSSNRTGGNKFTRWIIQSRQTIVGILQRYIGGAQEQGLAEALLIGYKDDLDKSLVQAYTNTGVVHVIAISGLHLGLIYGLLLVLLRPLRKRARLLRFLLIVAGLWAFALMAGAQPSVLRSAVMFSAIALGEVVARKASVFNTLGLSAFGLLCYNPFWLWDLGFQLSYSALGGILLFYQPLYRAVYFPNKALNWLWQLTALTLTAQVFTLPIGLYHFHQFPVLFLLTNLPAVPLSSFILLGEILLCLLHFFSPVAVVLGKMLHWLIWLMNAYILRFDRLSFALLEGFSLSMVQVVLLFGALALAGYAVLSKSRPAALLCLSFMLGFVALRSGALFLANRQRQLVVYNVPKHPAADIIWGRQVYFVGDTGLLHEGFERNFHLKPARTLFRVAAVAPVKASTVQLGKQKVLFYNGSFRPAAIPDVLVVSGKAALPDTLISATQVVLDATVPLFRRRQWKRLCTTVGCRLYDVQEKGAFVMKW